MKALILRLKENFNKEWAISMFLVVVLLVLLAYPTIARAVTYPSFSIVTVVEDDKVTIKTYNFPAGDSFKVRMGAYGTLGVGGTVVDTQASGGGGTFTATYSIPAGLAGATRIAIRLESPTSGYYAYNWFWNNTSNATAAPTSTPGPTNTPGGPTNTPAPTATGGAAPVSGFPYFYITGVDRDNDVTIQGYNFTKNDTYTVRMNTFGTLGLGGTVADASYATDGDGNFSATFSIPGGLAGLDRIAIRMDSNTTAYYAFNWFWNFDHP
jgi:hypothetical protein